jgi:hypothetical protein
LLFLPAWSTIWLDLPGKPPRVDASVKTIHSVTSRESPRNSRITRSTTSAGPREI